MLTIRYATEADIDFWRTLDGHIAPDVLARKLGAHECYVLCEDEQPIGVLRYGLFWDNTPFCNLLYLREDCRGKGYGRVAMERWEADMRGKGFEALMVSTQADEDAQFFYRKLGYRDCGSLILNDPPFSQAPELILCKVL